MAKPKPNVAVVCDPGVSEQLIASIAGGAVHARTFTSLAAALKERRELPYEALLIEEKKATKNAVAQIARQEDPLATIVVLSGGRVPRNAAYWKSLRPLFLLDPTDRFSSPARTVAQACQQTRKSIRLNALRQHHERSLNLGNNPALDLISELIHSCSKANDYSSILAAARVLAPAIEFHECHLILCAGESGARVLSGSSEHGAIEDFAAPDAPVTALSRLPIPQNSAALLLRHQTAGETLSGFLRHPWNSAITMKFPVGGKGKPHHAAYLVFVRTDLMTFTERDRWLLEIAYGPIAVSLEKVRFLEILGNRGREWRSTFDAISEPISVIDADYRIVRANRAFADAVGGDVKALKGKHCFTIFARKKRPCASCPAATAADRPFSGTRIKGKRNRDYLAWSYPLDIDSAGLRIQFYRNVSKEAQLTAALIQSEKMAALGSLISAIAHEINNPLAGILATSQILLGPAADTGLSPSAAEDIREIESAARRSKEIIDNLLGFSGEYRRAPMLLGEAVKSVLLFAKTALKHVAVHVDIQEDIAIGAAKASSLQQILFNLVTNAAHAMSVSGELYIKSETVGASVRISVRDTGKGIPKETLQSIFEPFYTEKSEGRGTGLGLSIVRTLLSRMNGSIHVSSVVGSGTVFTFEFPNGPGGERIANA